MPNGTSCERRRCRDRGVLNLIKFSRNFLLAWIFRAVNLQVVSIEKKLWKKKENFFNHQDSMVQLSKDPTYSDVWIFFWKNSFVVLTHHLEKRHFSLLFLARNAYVVSHSFILTLCKIIVNSDNVDVWW